MGQRKQKMMKRYCYGLLSFMMAAMLSVSLASCGDDENNGVVPPDSSASGSSVPDPEGTLEVYLNAGTDPTKGSHSSIPLTSRGYNWQLALDVSNNIGIWRDDKKAPVTDYLVFSIISCGKVNGLGSINTFSSSEWISQAVAREGYGYVVHFYTPYETGDVRIDEYIRLYITECKYDTSGNLAGVYVKYQRNWNPETK